MSNSAAMKVQRAAPAPSRAFMSREVAEPFAWTMTGKSLAA